MDIITTGTKKYIILSICICLTIFITNMSFAESVSQSDTKFQQYSQDISITNTNPKTLTVTQYNTYPALNDYYGDNQGFNDITNPYYNSYYNNGCNQFYNSGMYPLFMMYLLNHMNNNGNQNPSNNTQTINTIVQPTNYSLKK